MSWDAGLFLARLVGLIEAAKENYGKKYHLYLLKKTFYHWNEPVFLVNGRGL